MIKSMTAYASQEAEIGNLTINCELRSVNHRYCDINVKIPDRLRYIEAELRGLIAENISRGKVECAINYKKASDSTGFSVNLQAVSSLLAATEQIEQLMPAALSYSALNILAFPGIQQEPDIDRDAMSAGIKKLLKQTLTQFLEVRQREGSQLKILIEERCTKMQGFVGAASIRMPEVLRLIRCRLQDRIVELVAQPDFDRLEQELVMLAQKLDITEELDRLDTHISEVLRVLNQPEPVGRRLDFLMQELNREANTLGSKSADKEMTACAIELKVLIEQMREQIQNIE
ncbi:MAG: YicC family protein [Methylovulum sp.]|uniref:YicC/YloC family endoribonuclease n=1 Tax=Methylovulum sp. TaxID=1916980 RepID=UPI002624E164|nr:YicC/YloC family endoribonuclease [Methylovulum sp.]MDD2723614.1 YicC family protein [Methylovulum sp.]MDD5124321.1 YicC family protein [Methylovulum sp.]